jgi:hypothetical protein
MSHGNGQNAIEQYLVPIIEECGFTVNHFYLAEYDDYDYISIHAKNEAGVSVDCAGKSEDEVLESFYRLAGIPEVIEDVQGYVEEPQRSTRERFWDALVFLFNGPEPDDE